MIATLALGVSLVGGAGVASADGNGPGITGYSGVSGRPDINHGALINNFGGGGNKFFWCIDGGKGAPLNSDSFTLGASILNWQIATLLWKFDILSPGAAATTQQNLDYAALYHIIHTEPITTVGPNYGHANDPLWSDPAEYPANATNVASRVSALKNYASLYSGPFTSYLTKTQSGSTGQVQFGVKSAANQFISGVPYTATITGGGTFSGGGTTLTGVTPGAYDGGSAAVTPNINLTGVSAATVTVTFSNLPYGQIQKWNTPLSAVQNVITKTVADGQLIPSISFPAAPPTTFQPQVSTQTTSVTGPNQQITDALTVTTQGGTSWTSGVSVPVVSTLYGPYLSAPAQTGSVPVGAPVVGMVSTSVNGTGTYSTPPITPTAPGFYVWHETIAAGTNNSAWSAPFGVPSEIVNVPAAPPTKLSVTVTTQTSTAIATPGTQLTDTLIVDGVDPAHPLTITTKLYGPYATLPAVNSTGPAVGDPVVGTVSITAPSSGVFTTPPVTINAPGYYVWYETIPATNAFYNAWNPPSFPAAAETTRILPPIVKSSITVTTQTSAALVNGTTQLKDTLTVDGVDPAHPLTITTKLYGPYSTLPAVNSTGPAAGDPVAGIVSITAPYSGAFQTPSVTISSPGYYVWYETVPGDANYNSWKPPSFPAAAETTLIKLRPSVTTQTSTAIATPGTVLTDTLQVSGIDPDHPVVVSSTLYGPYATPPSTTTAPSPTDPSVTTVSVNVASSGQYVTPGVTITTPGYYVWYETIPGDTTYRAWKPSTFPQTTETTIVKWSPTVATVTSAATAVAGATLTDTLTVSGASSAHPVTISSTLYGPYATLPATTSGPAVGDPSVGTVSVTTSGTQTVYVTPGLVLPGTGYYVWHETIPADTYNNGWTPATFPQTSETTVVPAPAKANPQVTTVTSASVASVGTMLTDKLTVTGVNPAHQVTISTSLYGPYAELPATTTAPGATDPKVGTVTVTTIAGQTVYTTPALELPSPGYYVWHETIPADTYHNSWAPTTFPQTTETTVVKSTPQVTTVTSASVASVGTMLTDTLNVTGVNPAHPVTISSTLYGPYATLPATTSGPAVGDPSVGTVSVTTSGTQTVYVTPGLVLPGTGYYVWHEKITADTYNNGWAPATFPQTTETTIVKWSPTVSTVTSAATAVAGATLTDTLTVSGASSAHPVTISSTLYGPYATLPATTSGPAVGDPSVGTVSVTTSGTQTVYVTPGLVLPGTGYYVWHEKITADTYNNGWAPATFPQTSETTIVKWSPTVSTVTSAATAVAGATLTDTLTVSGASSAHPVTISSTLYGPYATLPATTSGPAVGDPSVGTVSVTTSGTQTVYVTPGLVLPGTGYYVWHEKITADTYNNGWTPATFPQTSETTVVPAPAKATPQVTTVTSASVASVGTMLTDKLTVTGVNPAHPVTISSTLYGPYAELPATTTAPGAADPSVGTVTVTTIAGQTVYTTPALELPSPGYYVWRETILGDEFNNPWTPPTFPQTTETTVVKSTPQVTTVTSASVASVGTMLTDKLTVTGVNPAHPVTISSTLYGPYAELPATTTAPGAADPSVGTVTVTTIAGQTFYETSALELLSPGYYVWRETIPGDEFNNPWTPPTFPQTTETTVVKSTPQVTTVTSVSVASVGTMLTDKLTVTGVNPAHPVTISTTLYGPYAELPATTTAPGAADPSVGTVTVTTIAGQTVYTTPALELLSPGYYVWHETIPADEYHNSWAPTTFPQTTETTVVKSTPQVTTVTSASVASVGTMLTDKLTVTGVNPAHQVTISSTLYGPYAELPATTTAPGAADPSVGTVTVTTIAGQTVYETSALELLSPGYYVWHETIPADTYHNSWAPTTFPQTTETTVVKSTPQVTTVTSASVASVGTMLTDKLTVTGVNPAHQVTISASLYGPYAELPATTTAPGATDPKVGTVTVTTIAGQTVYTTPGLALPSAGYYVWHETIPADTYHNSWAPTTFPQTTETTVVKSTPQVTTVTSASVASVGTMLTDKLTVTGVNPAHQVTISSTLYGPYAELPATTTAPGAADPSVGTVTVTTIAGQTVYETSALELLSPGYYVWHETIPADTYHNSWAPTTFPQTTETTVVKSTPQVTTVTSASVASVGTMLTDKLTVTGVNPAHQVTISTSLYGPYAELPATTTAPGAADPSVGTVTVTTIAGQTVYTTPALELPSPGYYVWHETIPADTYHNSWAPTTFPQTTETTVVKSTPQVTTVTSASVASVGTMLTDKLTVTGVNPAHQVTISSTLYGPYAELPATTTAPGAADPSVGTVTVTTIAGQTVYETSALELLSPGYYVWHETIPADTYHNSWAPTTFPQTTETTVVKSTPQVTTVTSASVASVGTMLTDKLTVTGVNPAHPVTISTTLYGPYAELPATTNTGPGAGDLKVQTVTVAIPKDGTYVTPGVVITAPGYYVWYEKIVADTYNNAWTPPTFPLTYETTIIKWAPQVTTKTSAPIAAAGSMLSDTLIVTGNNPNHPVTITSTLYGPYAELPATSNGPARWTLRLELFPPPSPDQAPTKRPP
ncbi:hypothetical protein [Nakamurella antarctica]|uniref:hypothetical protein n=1 Tax=Nakamurella antarctica TaxID=1902245 RepID=UPI0013DE54E1|nr:hypothetical protein [Nakamurella antarctica]